MSLSRLAWLYAVDDAHTVSALLVRNVSNTFHAHRSCRPLRQSMHSRQNKKAKTLMKAYGGEHEARYRDEVTMLRMVTTKDHVAVSDYAQLVSFVPVEG